MKKLLLLLLIIPVLFSCATQKVETTEEILPVVEETPVVVETPIVEEEIKIDSWVSKTIVADALELEIGFDGENYFISIPYQLNYFLPMVLLEDGSIYNVENNILIAGDLQGIATYYQSDYMEELSFTNVSDNFKDYYTREQDPKDYPYNQEDVIINAGGDVILAGTLTTPKENDKETAIVLITGSGQQDRNQEIANHRPFLVVSDYLTRNGYSVLRYDDRGAGLSTGDITNLTTFDSADDTSAVVDYLVSRGFEKIILVGHSEGGTIALITASENENVKGMLLLAPPALSGLEISLDQNRTSLSFAGYDKTSIDLIVGVLELGFKSSIEGNKDEAIQYFASLFGEEAAIAQYEQIQTPWIKAYFSLDPKVYISEVKVPTYIFQGMKDTQVSPNINLTPMKEALDQSGAIHDVFTFENANHLFQNSETGSLNEYGIIEETISEEVLEKLVQVLDTI